MFNNMDISQQDPFQNIHLQWFADEDDAGADEDADESAEDGGETDIEDEIADLKKSLNSLKKESAGKDRKVSELLEENKKLKSRKSKDKERARRQVEYDNMTAEELKREIEHREEEIKAEYERELNEIREQNKQNEFIQTIYRIAPEIDNLPPHVIKLLTIPRDADEDKLREVMEAAVTEVNTMIHKNRLVIDNKKRLGSRPQSGEFDSKKSPNEKEWARMSEDDKRTWAKYATDEQLNKVQDAGLSM